MGAPSPLPRAIPIHELLRMVEGGEVKLPMFQRGFVWSEEKIENLLDSIYQGFPVGTLLLWQTHDQLPEEADLGGFSLPATPALLPRNYVLDGQQRLVSLFGALKTPEGNVSEKFPVYFDLRTETFTHEGNADFVHRISLTGLLEVTSFLRSIEPLRSLEGSEELLSRAQELVERFQRYQVSVLIVRENDVTKIAPIFERINSTATRLTLFDFMVAALWKPGFNFKDQVNLLQESLEPKGFDDLDEVTIVRALAAVVYESANRETIMGLRDKSVDELTEALTQSKNALERAVDLLSTDLNVVEDSLLPYERQLVLLSFVLSKHPTPSAAQSRVLHRWFWRTSFSERYRRGGEGLFDDDLTTAVAALDNPDELERFGAPPTTVDLTKGEFRVTSAFTKAFVAMLAGAAPKNLRTGRDIDVRKALSPYNRREFHHIFPKAYLRDEEVAAAKANSLVNICMLTAEDNKAIGSRPPGDYFRELRETHGDQLERIMETNLIPPSCLDHLLADDYDAFLDERASHLQARIADLYYSA